MKIILIQKVIRLGNIGDVVDVKTGYARNYLIPNGRAMRYSRENLADFEGKKAALAAAFDTARKNAESQIDKVQNAKFYMIRQAGDTGHLYGSVSSRDIARMLADLTGIVVESAAVMMGAPIKTIGAFDTKIALHPDVIVPVKIYVAQTQDEIDALVAGKVLTFGTKKIEEEPVAETPVGAESVEEKAEEKHAEAEEKKARKRAVKKASENEETKAEKIEGVTE